ncbi:MAG: PbpA, partial [Desulfobacteraceae bacterium]|nr:PbpA [Desulfobacteraceae bacterium]
MLREQAHTEIDQRRKQNFQKFIKPAIYAFSIAAIIVIGIICFNFIYTALFSNKANIVESQKKEIKFETDEKTKPPKLTNIEIKKILENQNFLNSEKESFTITFKNKPYKIVTSLNIPLQQFLNKKLDRLKQLTRGKPQRIAIVVMEAGSGNILALTGFDLLNPDTNPCFKSDFPAASIFKIVTAAAAVEELGFTPHTPLYFNGSKYTLYKRQLRDVKNKYTTKISFNKAFAESVNPVFGKIGRNRLGNTLLEKYSNKFEFNKDIDSELVFEPSKLEITDNPYKWAEIGCGFNHTTTISPVFGAMISSTIINDGKRVIPSIVEKIVDSQNDIIYDKKNIILTGTISQKTASIVQNLMQKTIETGTARKTFKGHNRDKILSKLVIGGKTGSIYNREHTIKYDWFTGFAEEKTNTANGKKNKIAVSIVVGHGKYIGTRAGSYGKM